MSKQSLEIPAIYNSLTGKYALSKTLKFELVPTAKTVALLKKNNIFEQDEKRAENYQAIKPLFDNLHREFAAESLREKNIDPEGFKIFAQEYRKLRAQKKLDLKQLRKIKEAIWKSIGEAFETTASSWKERYQQDNIKLKSNGYKILTDAAILQVLAKKHPEQEKIITSFNKFFTYFEGFNETRENFYKADGTATAIASRIADNCIIFLENCMDFEKFYAPVKTELSITNEAASFEDKAYLKCLVQADIETYNGVIGQLNKRMKILKDEHKSAPGFKKSHYPLLRKLNNQILGEREKRDFFEQIEDEADAWHRLEILAPMAKRHFAELQKLFSDLAKGVYLQEDESGIYLTNKAVNTLSRRMLQSWFDFEAALPQRGGKAISGQTKVAHFVSLADIRAALNKLTGEQIFKADANDSSDRLAQFLKILHDEFSRLLDDHEHGGERVSGFNAINDKLANLVQNRKGGIKSTATRGTIKAYFDAGLPVFQMGKYFSLASNDKKGADIPIHTNGDFYNLYGEYSEGFDFAKQFDLFRNFLTKKPGDDEQKTKLNFDKPNLLGGWAESPLGKAQFRGYILRKSGDFYLGVTTDEYFLDLEKYKEELSLRKGDSLYEKLEYYQLNWGKNIVGGQVYPSYTRARLGEKLSFQEHKIRISPREHVSFIKDLLREKYLSRYSLLNDFLKRDFANPQDMQEAFSELITSGMKFVPVRAHRINEQEFTKKNGTSFLYLFKIKNKDLAKQSGESGGENIHTMYWRTLFSESNLHDLQIWLQGGAEIFLRRGKPHELEVKRVKEKDVLAHKRYAEDKLFLHIPITLNAQAPKAPHAAAYNATIRELLAAHPGACVIGIDRGEKHILYYSVINSTEQIIEQGSMNALEVAGKMVNFHEKLVKLEKERRENRRAWEPVRRIKDLKKGYVSHAVHKICQLIDKYQAVVVLEDLNMRFKQVRGGIERSVYQQFEKALVDKLGYTVFKDRAADEPGGVRRGYQLAAPFESFEKLGKQTGILFYTQADYTSVTDPLTGFRKNIYIKNAERPENIRQLFAKQKITMHWDEKLRSYVFSYDQASFTQDASSKVWELYADIHRIKRTKIDGYWQYELVNPNDMLEKLFAAGDILNPHDGLWDKLMALDVAQRIEFDGAKRNFWQALIFVFNLVLDLRNSSSRTFKKNSDGEWTAINNEDVDFIASPVLPRFQTAFSWKGVAYKARLGGFEERVIGIQKDNILSDLNGDANGAYNIARKGLIILERIQKDPQSKNLFISKLDWDKKVTDRKT